jgi:hypothetical protein
MSMTLLVPMCAVAFAQVADLNSRLRVQGFDVVLEESDLQTHSGFLPARWAGRRTGFEYGLDATDESGLEIPTEFGRCSGVVSLYYSGRPDEAAAAYAVAATLADMSRSGVLDDEGNWLTPRQTYNAARYTAWFARVWALFNR